MASAKAKSSAMKALAVKRARAKGKVSPASKPVVTKITSQSIKKPVVTKITKQPTTGKTVLPPTPGPAAAATPATPVAAAPAAAPVQAAPDYAAQAAALTAGQFDPQERQAKQSISDVTAQYNLLAARQAAYQKQISDSDAAARARSADLSKALTGAQQGITNNTNATLAANAATDQSARGEDFNVRGIGVANGGAEDHALQDRGANDAAIQSTYGTGQSNNYEQLLNAMGQSRVLAGGEAQSQLDLARSQDIAKGQGTLQDLAAKRAAFQTATLQDLQDKAAAQESADAKQAAADAKDQRDFNYKASQDSITNQLAEAALNIKDDSISAALQQNAANNKTALTTTKIKTTAAERKAAADRHARYVLQQKSLAAGSKTTAANNATKLQTAKIAAQAKADAARVAREAAANRANVASNNAFFQKYGKTKAQYLAMTPAQQAAVIHPAKAGAGADKPPLTPNQALKAVSRIHTAASTVSEVLASHPGQSEAKIIGFLTSSAGGRFSADEAQYGFWLATHGGLNPGQLNTLKAQGIDISKLPRAKKASPASAKKTLKTVLGG
ncbi:hypothetical protein NBH00_05160 [Paraconexibacter antarcticus]|uniref:Uncharacterized protein n=1 Tax=Paraconexibacter antarcticus TaxID=2949664 RepID=A0ABY5DVL2_9ACTN|nr:hypothetical protein [Paraconexibacter antarcticus]UTI65599.1 hypothetical protein NBH00_05160 [Paraconexibacter antarcticus]